MIAAPPARDGLFQTALRTLAAQMTVLDARLQHEVARIRREQPGLENDAFRGQLIDESDVDLWLNRLSAAVPNDFAFSIDDQAAGGAELARPGPLRQLAVRFDLRPFDLCVIVTCLAPELDAAYSGLYAYIQDDVTRKYATVELVLTLWCNGLPARLDARGRFHPTAPLRRHRLLHVSDDNSPTPFLAHPIWLEPRIIAFLLGAQDLDPALFGVTRLFGPRRAEHSGGEALLAAPGENALGRSADVARLAALARPVLSADRSWHEPPGGEPGGLLVSLLGSDHSAKRDLAQQLATCLDRALLVVDSSQLLAAEGAPGLVARIGVAFREALLQPAILFWQQADVLLATDPALVRAQAALREHLAGWPGCSLFDLSHDRPDVWPNPGPMILRLDFALPPPETRRALWEHTLNGRTHLAADVDLDLLAGSFRLTGGEISAAAAAARHAAAWRGPGPGTVTMRDLLAACRSHSNQQLGLLARKILPRYTWRDLVLPADRLAQLREMCNNVRFGPQVYERWGFDRKLSYGKGLNVLFSGQSGTGKTMAAEVLATDLGLDIYRIDLSTVVSKYIGETEKNLERIFREGRTSNAILFFDEADSLFGKRSEVKDSHDRYANIEIGYLLQKMEEYDGIVILATNLRKNLDEAFVRRLHGAIDFPMPEEEDRLSIWQSMFPPEAPLAPDADLSFLAAHFKFSGGNIKNIVVAAAFLAAEEGTAIGMSHLARATRRELQKIGKLALESDFGPYFDLLRVGT